MPFVSMCAPTSLPLKNVLQSLQSLKNIKQGVVIQLGFKHMDGFRTVLSNAKANWKEFIRGMDTGIMVNRVMDWRSLAVQIICDER